MTTAISRVVTIGELVRQLQGIPPLRTRDGVVEAELGGAWHSLDHVRAQVDERALTELEERGVPRAWLVSGGATAQVTEDGEWTRLLEENAKRDWVVAEALCHAVAEGAPWESDDRILRERTDDIHASLTSLAFSIKARRPVPVALGHAFHVWQEGDSRTAWGQWQLIDNAERLNLGEMLQARAQVATKLDTGFINRLVAVFTEQIFEQNITAPGFQSSWRNSRLIWEVSLEVAQHASSAAATPHARAMSTSGV